jgi:hypothetical protein
VSGDDSWQGLIKFVAIHSRALSAAQVLQNYNAGVGQRYYLLFNVASQTGVPQSYIEFTVSQYDSYSYLFFQPTFISLDPTAKPGSIPISGMRIGINGGIPQVGQAYVPLSGSITAANYTAQGEVLSNVGTVIGLESGPLTDVFFLQFDTLGSQSYPIPQAQYTAPPMPLGPVVADVGVRTFASVNSTLSALTGVPVNNPTVSATYQSVLQQLPSVPTLEAFSAANQVGTAQLAIQYCNTMVNTPSLAAQVLPGVTFSASTFPAQTSLVSSALAARVLGTSISGQMPAVGMSNQPMSSTVTTELNNLIGILCTGSNPCTNAARAMAVTAAACAAAFGSADMSIE